MSRLLPFSTAMMLSCLSTPAKAAPAALDALHLLEQAGQLPQDFQQHFFDAPLVIRVEKDGRYLGDARAVLSRENAVTLLDFVDSGDSRLPPAARTRWLQALSEARPLGRCRRDCPEGLVGLHYSLESSLLSLATDNADVWRGQDSRYHTLPEQGSRGVILHHQLNLHAAEGLASTGRYAVSAQASLGHWTLQGSAQVERGGELEDRTRYALHDLYLQREHRDHFVRAGAFMADFQGIARQPRGPGSIDHTTIGLMAGSSDALSADTRSPSLYPVYISAEREGSVEVHRDGVLIMTQPLQPGLQTLDTARLPGGIYTVELRVIEDGRETSREVSVIHKPQQWHDLTRRWRYSAFAGRQRRLLGSTDVADADAHVVGAGVNYLAHARAVLGVAAQKTGNEQTAALSLDWQVHDRLSIYSQGFRSNQHGSGVDAQGMLRYRNGSLVISSTRSMRRPGIMDQRALAWNHRLGDTSHVSARVFRQGGAVDGSGVDLAVSRRQPLRGLDANWRVALFDRPGTVSTGLRRNRGVDFTLNVALGRSGRRYSGSLGSRTGRHGERDAYASAGVQQLLEHGMVRAVAAQVTLDGEGAGLSGSSQFEHPALRGDAYAQRSSVQGLRSGGINLESTLAVGAGRVAMAGVGPSHMATTGMIVDVRSDLPDVALRAHDSQGGSYALRPGRNLLPVPAYRTGALQIDFDGHAAPPATLQPSFVPYHLNKGGVAHARVDLVSTFTVIGQLRSASGEPLAGARVLNHAGRSVAEADGFFAVEMSRRLPTLEVHHPKVSHCTFELDGSTTAPTGDAWLAGILNCPPSSAPAPEYSPPSKEAAP